MTRVGGAADGGARGQEGARPPERGFRSAHARYVLPGQLPRLLVHHDGRHQGRHGHGDTGRRGDIPAPASPTTPTTSCVSA